MCVCMYVDMYMYVYIYIYISSARVRVMSDPHQHAKQTACGEDEPVSCPTMVPFSHICISIKKLH